MALVRINLPCCAQTTSATNIGECMKYILILDTETTGLDAAKCKVIEIAAILYHIPTRSVMSQASTLCYAEGNDAYSINRIEPDSLKLIPPSIEENSIQLISNMMIVADAIIAHNAEFDKKFIDTVIPLQVISKNKQWICTRNDVVWPIRKGVALNLVHIAVDLGVPVVNAHRALSDCNLLLGCLDCIEDIDFFLDKSGQGRMTYHAVVNYEQRQIVKDAGFKWDNLKKTWFAKLTEEEAKSLPFMAYPSDPTEKAC